MYCRQGLRRSLRILALLHSETVEENLTTSLNLKSQLNLQNSVEGHKPSSFNSQMLTTICLITALKMAAPTHLNQTYHIHTANPCIPTRLLKPGWFYFGGKTLEHKTSPCHSPPELCFRSMIRWVCNTCFVESWSLRFKDTRHTGLGYLWKTVLHKTQICNGMHWYCGWSRAWRKQPCQLWAGSVSEVPAGFRKAELERMQHVKLRGHGRRQEVNQTEILTSIRMCAITSPYKIESFK